MLQSESCSPTGIPHQRFPPTWDETEMSVSPSRQVRSNERRLCFASILKISAEKGTHGALGVRPQICKTGIKFTHQDRNYGSCSAQLPNGPWYQSSSHQGLTDTSNHRSAGLMDPRNQRPTRARPRTWFSRRGKASWNRAWISWIVNYRINIKLYKIIYYVRCVRACICTIMHDYYATTLGRKSLVSDVSNR